MTHNDKYERWILTTKNPPLFMFDYLIGYFLYCGACQGVANLPPRAEKYLPCPLERALYRPSSPGAERLVH